MAEAETAKVAESPGAPSEALCAVTALARFEFEPGKGNEGTKILMVEWQDEDNNRNSGSWEVTWSGKTTVLGAENKTDNADNTKRLYFLLPPQATVPPQVILSWKAQETAPTQSTTLLTLPAIFTPELGATTKNGGTKGVLHTIWAKSRLQVLEREIQQEQALNLEGIGLEMALSEREWIQSTFGLVPKPPTLNLTSPPKKAPNGQPSPSLQSPRTPGGRRLSEKLKDLSLGTSEKDLAKGVNTPTREFHPLSPDVSDLAYSSFSSFRTGLISPKMKKTNAKVAVAHNPPEHIVKQQQQQQEQQGASLMQFGHLSQQHETEVEDESLFAIALSPRTPDVSKSPFSFQSEDIAPYAQIKGERSNQ